MLGNVSLNNTDHFELVILPRSGVAKMPTSCGHSMDIVGFTVL